MGVLPKLLSYNTRAAYQHTQTYKTLHYYSDKICCAEIRLPLDCPGPGQGLGGRRHSLPAVATTSTLVPDSALPVVAAVLLAADADAVAVVVADASPLLAVDDAVASALDLLQLLDSPCEILNKKI